MRADFRLYNCDKTNPIENQSAFLFGGSLRIKMSQLSTFNFQLSTFNFQLFKIDCLLICQAAKHIVIFPINVIAACKLTNHSRVMGLSKKCQVQAHIALTKAGNIPKDRLRQAKLSLASAYNQISQIAVIHSMTLEM